MNKFKKLVAVLVSVVMACVFATGVFATDYVDDLSAARAEVNGYLTSAGVYGMDGVVNSLNESQLRALRDNSVALRNALTQAKNALNGAKSEADVRTAVSTALSQVRHRRFRCFCFQPAHRFFFCSHQGYRRQQRYGHRYHRSVCCWRAGSGCP